MSDGSSSPAFAPAASDDHPEKEVNDRRRNANRRTTADGGTQRMRR